MPAAHNRQAREANSQKKPTSPAYKAARRQAYIVADKPVLVELVAITGGE
jgi:hypothetical protein